MNEVGQPSAGTSSEPLPELQPGLVESLTGAYAMLLENQRTSSSAYVRWGEAHSRSHEFAWLERGPETLLMSGGTLKIRPDSAIHAAVQKMMATMELNPYERELRYGFPYIMGMSGQEKIRAPLLTIPISIRAAGGDLAITVSDDDPQFNSLPFRTEVDTSAREVAIARLMEHCPSLPLTPDSLGHFCAAVCREFGIARDGSLDGNLCGTPKAPNNNNLLTIGNYAACFIAPKTSYFLVSDLKSIGKSSSNIPDTALGWMIGKRPPEPVDHSSLRARKAFFPFPANPSQRRVAHLVDDPRARITVVQGPPGTGKSLTIANLACHLVAKGKKVLITSQKDKALHVVDTKLQKLGLDQIPMTLLRRDGESRKQLRERLVSIRDDTDRAGASQDGMDPRWLHDETCRAEVAEQELLRLALLAEHELETADRSVLNAAGRLSKMVATLASYRSFCKAEFKSRRRSDSLGESLSSTRERLQRLAHKILEDAAALRVQSASKTERIQLREFANLLGRDQTNHQNFRIFDKLKTEPERCRMLLKILPCWIMTPDDVARLFPCLPNLFDVVIIDEASQCDLPSMVPVLYRAHQAVVVGDSKQMQAQRFAFTAGAVPTQAWIQYGLNDLDPERWLGPENDLLRLASVRMDEEAFLNEHYRCLPGIIGFSNERWYGEKLRVMRDVDDKRFGEPGTPPVSLHRINGHVAPRTQENQEEAAALVKHLRRLLDNPAYSEASFGVICLFEQQMRLVNDLVIDQIPPEMQSSHNLVVVNPDGFQGDERDVVLYSLSYDGHGMERDQLSARQADRPHIQGMLNVAFTRARDEIHIFHSADISDFGMSNGAGPIKDWLEYCSKCQQQSPRSDKSIASQLSKAQSNFEHQVLSALAKEGVEVISQFPSCGFFIDIVASRDNTRIAIECDGEFWHLDEHGKQKVEDVERQEILERAGWKIVRIPYRSWRENSSLQVARIVAEFGKTMPADGPYVAMRSAAVRR